MLTTVHEERPSGSRSTDSPDVLLERVATGDRDAFAAFYDALSSRVYGLVLKLVRDPSQSEEVTQEVFLEVWQQASRFNAERGSAVSWVITMTHRRAVDRIRASQASRNRDERIGIRDWDPPADVVAEHVEITMETQRVRAALARLTEFQRQAVVLAYFRGLSHSEVAELLHIPIGTVKTRLRDGMIRLRDEMGVAS